MQTLARGQYNRIYPASLTGQMIDWSDHVTPPYGDHHVVCHVTCRYGIMWPLVQDHPERFIQPLIFLPRVFDSGIQRACSDQIRKWLELLLNGVIRLQVVRPEKLVDTEGAFMDQYGNKWMIWCHFHWRFLLVHPQACTRLSRISTVLKVCRRQ